MSVKSILSTVNQWSDKCCSVGVCAAIALLNISALPFFPASVAVPVMTAQCCLTAAVSKLLKRILNQSRPAGAPKLSPGMPSNHATSLSFLAVVSTYGIARYTRLQTRVADGSSSTTSPSVAGATALSAAILLFSIYASSLRVVLGHHTPAQVVVGYLFGALSGTATLAVNYHGYTGRQLGGRIDELPQNTKVLMAVCSALVEVLSFTAIVRGSPLANYWKK